MERLLSVSFLMLAFLFASPAHAYVGPGLGLGAIGAVLAFLLSIVLAVAAFVWYPVKRMFKRTGRTAKPSTGAPGDKDSKTKD